MVTSDDRKRAKGEWTEFLKRLDAMNRRLGALEGRIDVLDKTIQGELGPSMDQLNENIASLGSLGVAILNALEKVSSSKVGQGVSSIASVIGDLRKFFGRAE